MSKINKFNSLIKEKSPYLLQHSTNPINWYGWNEETLAKAKSENIPIFLSVGYSTCYWCHVMEREIFEDEKISEIMNANFINIKVDREERPDIDRIYMQALQSMTGTGGWPMNMFLTPDLNPFYGATYIPPKSKYGRAGFEDVVAEIIKVWNEKRVEVIASGEKITQLLKNKIEENNIKNHPDFEVEKLNNSFLQQALQYFDEDYGGFGKGNKFPRPAVLDLLLLINYKTNDFNALNIVNYTLKKMLDGGINDQIAGGFHRYSVDYFWRVPHFEKMLYDQGQIAKTYFDAYSVTHKEEFLNTGISILDYVRNKMTGKEGGFYSAEDAESAVDSNNPDVKEEGAYYLWTWDEIKKIANEDEFPIICFYFGIEKNGNTINDPHNVFGDKNVLFNSYDLYDTAKKFSKPPEAITEIINSFKRKLLTERNFRIPPQTDDKILTSWNSIMINGFIRGFEITGNNNYLISAKNAADFIISKLYNKEKNILYHRYREGEIKYAGTLEDYAFFTDALINLYETTFEIKYIDLAIELNTIAIKKFYDIANGGFFSTEEKSNDIILRIKDIYDGAEPSANSIQIRNLLRIAVITEEKGYYELARKSIELFYTNIENNPFSYPYLLLFLNMLYDGIKEILITGSRDEKTFNEFLEIIRKEYITGRILIYANPESGKISPFIKDSIKNFRDVNILICENFKCNLPIKTKEELNNFIKEKKLNDI